MRHIRRHFLLLHTASAQMNWEIQTKKHIRFIPMFEERTRIPMRICKPLQCRQWYFSLRRYRWWYFIAQTKWVCFLHCTTRRIPTPTLNYKNPFFCLLHFLLFFWLRSLPLSLSLHDLDEEIKSQGGEMKRWEETKVATPRISKLNDINNSFLYHNIKVTPKRAQKIFYVEHKHSSTTVLYRII